MKFVKPWISYLSINFKIDISDLFDFLFLFLFLFLERFLSLFSGNISVRPEDIAIVLKMACYKTSSSQDLTRGIDSQYLITPSVSEPLSFITGDPSFESVDNFAWWVIFMEREEISNEPGMGMNLLLRFLSLVWMLMYQRLLFLLLLRDVFLKHLL